MKEGRQFFFFFFTSFLFCFVILFLFFFCCWSKNCKISSFKFKFISFLKISSNSESDPQIA